MNGSYEPAAWQNFYLMMGTANAAITGLAFVALSIHLRAIFDHPVLRPRAVVLLIVLTLQIVIAAIVLTPQPREVMGVEIVILNIAFLAIDMRQGVSYGAPRRAALTIAIRAAYMYSGVSLLVGLGGGFYVLAAVLVATLARSMVGCWTLLTAAETP
jgi:modulator of FtsH protease